MISLLKVTKEDPVWLQQAFQRWKKKLHYDGGTEAAGYQALGAVKEEFLKVPLTNDKLRIQELERQLREVQRELVSERLQADKTIRQLEELHKQHPQLSKKQKRKNAEIVDFWGQEISRLEKWIQQGESDKGWATEKLKNLLTEMRKRINFIQTKQLKGQ